MEQPANPPIPNRSHNYIMGFALPLHPIRHGLPTWLVTHQTLGGFHYRRAELAVAGENQAGVRLTLTA